MFMHSAGKIVFEVCLNNLFSSLRDVVHDISLRESDAGNPLTMYQFEGLHSFQRLYS